MSTRELLVRTGLVSNDQLAAIPVGKPNVIERVAALGVVSEDQLADTLAETLHVERVPAERLLQVSRDVLALVPGELVVEHRILPIAADADTITLAMSDPDGEPAAEEMGFFAGRFVIRAIARASDLRTAIERHYGVRLVARNETGKLKALDVRVAK